MEKTALGSSILLRASNELVDMERLELRPILLIGGTHGDEPEGVELAERALAWLTKEADSGAQLTPWVCVPRLNVDGLAQKTRVNGRGVDLNRNYPASDWSANAEKPRYFPGPSAASEPEIQGIVELIERLDPRLVIHCHSWEPCIVYTGALGKIDALRLARASGYQAKESIGYPTPGSLSSYAWTDRGLPTICIEERDGVSDLSGIWPRFAKAFAEIFSDHSMRERA